MTKLSEEARKRMVIALTDEKVAEEVADTIDLGVESGGVTIDDGAAAADKVWSSSKVETEIGLGGGGGGAHLGTLLSDPALVSPADDGKSYFLQVVGAAGTSFTSDAAYQASGVDMSFGAHTVADLQTLFASVFGDPSNITLAIQDAGELNASDLANIFYDGPAGGDTTTVQALVDAINVESNILVGYDIAAVKAGFVGDPNVVKISAVGDTFGIGVSDAVTAVTTLKQFYAGALSTINMDQP